MIRRERVPLAALTTFGTGGKARELLELEREDDLEAAAMAARAGAFFILGGGSNLLAPDAGLDAAVLRPAFKGISFEGAGEGRVRAAIAAGESWDGFVKAAAARGLWGVENLAGIPGTAGGAAVQNIGAYGAALSDTFDYADAFDVRTGKMQRLDRAMCAFGYRDSIFKRRPELLITRIALLLCVRARANLSYRDPSRRYRDLESFLGAHADPSPAEMGAAIRAVRAGKFPDLAREGTAGSFFANPVLPEPAARALAARFREMPLFPLPETGAVKVPLGWILDHALDLRGFSYGSARVYEKHALVIAAQRGARSSDIEALARLIERKVFEETGLVIEREVITLRARAA